jgi:hypothetical protein
VSNKSSALGARGINDNAMIPGAAFLIVRKLICSLAKFS